VFAVNAASAVQNSLAWRWSASCNVLGSGEVVEYQQLKAPCWASGMDTLLIVHLAPAISMGLTWGIR